MQNKMLNQTIPDQGKDTCELQCMSFIQMIACSAQSLEHFLVKQNNPPTIKMFAFSRMRVHKGKLVGIHNEICCLDTEEDVELLG